MPAQLTLEIGAPGAGDDRRRRASRAGIRIDPHRFVWKAFEVHIRRRTHGDIDACLAIAERVHREDGYPPRLTGELRGFVTSPDALAAWVAVDDEVVGQVVLNPRTSREVMMVLEPILGDAPVAVVARLLVAPGKGTAARGGDI